MRGENGSGDALPASAVVSGAGWKLAIHHRKSGRGGEHWLVELLLDPASENLVVLVINAPNLKRQIVTGMANENDRLRSVGMGEPLGYGAYY